MKYLIAIALCAASAADQKTMIPAPRANSVVAACQQPAFSPKGPVKKTLVVQSVAEVTLNSLTVTHYLSPSYPYNIGLRFDFAPVVSGVKGTPQPFSVAAGTSTKPAPQKHSVPLAPGDYELTIWGGTNGSPAYPVTVKACRLLPSAGRSNPSLEIK